ncbi:hypothetical protein [Zhongshania sp.]|jgi:hypothetical protein|uniref:hypothetical protein n=1 Tax=Zhongshania sp. TaxID=1971902 RepID=UPI002A7F7BAB|nr:hypothetical protein [Zhongshania sp.]
MAYIGNQKEVSKFKEMSPGLIRQRRNLIGSSIALLIIEFGDVTLDKINILGNELKLNNSGSIQVAAFIACTYFLFRYYQYIQANNGMGIEPEYNRELRRISFQYLKLIKSDRKSQLNNVIAAGLKLQIIYSVMDEFNALVKHPPLELGVFRSIWLRERAVFHLITHTPLITDYILPYVLAIAAIAAHLWRYIPFY